MLPTQAVTAPARRMVRRPTPAVLQLALLAAPVLAYAILGWTRRWNADDGFINFRVVDMLLHGHGPVFNAGERIEIYTSTLWLGLLAVGEALVPGDHVEWVSVVLGLTFAVGGVAAAVTAATLSMPRAPGVVAVPLGALVFVALPPAWEYATSGLESGLSFAWLGLTYLGLVAARHGSTYVLTRPSVLAVAIGLGVLIRPDYAFFCAAFLLVLVAIQGRRRGWWMARFVLLAGALPFLYQLFRMGYFAALTPNTAIAKEAGATHWGRGLRYLWDTAGTYWVPVVLVPLLAVAVARARAATERRDTLLVVAPIVAAVLHLLFIAKVGGDFMHGRFVLPGLFALLLPVMAIPLGRTAAAVALVALVVVWAGVAAIALRPAYDGTREFSDTGIADERGYYASSALNEHPVTLDDYRAFWWAQKGHALRRREARGERVVTFDVPNPPPYVPQDMPVLEGLPTTLVAGAGTVGLVSYAAGPEVRIVDRFGLGDPIAARVEGSPPSEFPQVGGGTGKNRPGHEKLLMFEWVLGRFGERGARRPPEVDPARVRAAQDATSCGELREVLVAVAAPLTASRFLDNFRLSSRATRLRIPYDPLVARRRLCP